jgi:succinate dehydrogenase/fumarate reductase flavoprotein subunit
MAGFITRPVEYTPPDSVEENIKDRIKGFGYFLCDQEAIRQTYEMSGECIRDLELMGAFYRRDSNGALCYMANKVKNGKPQQLRSIVSPSILHTYGVELGLGKLTADVIRREIKRRGIKYLEYVAATSLLTYNGEVVGATALDYRNGEFLVIRAKSTILATSSGGHLWAYSSTTRHNTGDGMIMAFRIGAELNSIEMNQWHFGNLMEPKSMSRYQLLTGYSIKEPRVTLRWYNSKLEPFLEGREALVALDKGAQAAGLGEEIKRGVARQRGGYYASFRHFDSDDLKSTKEFAILNKLGYDLTKDLVECGMETHTMLGGIHTNIKMETTIPGLYTAGSITGQFMPILHHCLVSGKIAAQNACKRAREIATPELDWEQVKKEEERVFSFVKVKEADGQSYPPAKIMKKIRDIMYWKALPYFKSEKGMKEGLEELRRIREDMLPKMCLSSGAGQFNYEWSEAISAVNMLDLSELIIGASLIRKETRGCFQRLDYPETDNKNWLKQIIVKFENGKTKFFTIPVRLLYTKPDDYLQTLPGIWEKKEG